MVYIIQESRKEAIMTELSQNVLSSLLSSGKRSFTLLDLTNGSNCHLSNISAKKVIAELEENGKIESTGYISGSYNIV